MSRSCITLATPSQDRCQLNRSQLHMEVEASGAARFKKSEEGRCMSCKMLVIPLSRPSDGCFYLFSTDECEQMFLRDSPHASPVLRGEEEMLLILLRRQQAESDRCV